MKGKLKKESGRWIIIYLDPHTVQLADKAALDGDFAKANELLRLSRKKTALHKDFILEADLMYPDSLDMEVNFTLDEDQYAVINKELTEEEYSEFIESMNEYVKKSELVINELPIFKQMSKLSFDDWVKFKNGELKIK